MNEKICTEENYQKLLATLNANKHRKGALMGVLNDCQKIYGCVPLNAQKVISEELNIPVGEIYGVVTFYSQFSLEPKGDYIIGVCMGTACYVRDAQKLIDEFIKGIPDLAVGETTPDGKFTLEATRCIGACGLAPVITINEDVYGKLPAEDVAAIIAKY